MRVLPPSILVCITSFGKPWWLFFSASSDDENNGDYACDAANRAYDDEEVLVQERVIHCECHRVAVRRVYCLIFSYLGVYLP